MELYNKTTFECSKLITQHYSTSFTLGIKTLDKKFHPAIYAIYGFVRYADEIVDTFHLFDKASLLKRFKNDTYLAIEEKISLNPVLHSFQTVVNEFFIEKELIEAFLVSMEMDLSEREYNPESYHKYIYGSAEVVGLMCLRVFCEGDTNMYDRLKESARSLGAAFQKVNFLRDIKSDFKDRGRVYFPEVNFEYFSDQDKQAIEDDIQKDFDQAIVGIKQLPKGAKLGVYLAFVYYKKLFKKIKRLTPSTIMNKRVRVTDNRKMILLVQSYLKNALSLV